jgi:hypothetical protein
MAFRCQSLWALSSAALPDGELGLHYHEARLTLQETSLIFSPVSALRPALPYALITGDHNYIPAHLLQSVTLPPNVEIGKYYYKKHVEAITQELSDAQSLGQAAAEEWSKGLDDKGKERMKTADNWEKWEARDLQERSRAVSAAPSFTGRSRKESSTSPMRQMPSPVIHTPVPLGKYSFAVPFYRHERWFLQLLPSHHNAQPNDCSSLFAVHPAKAADGSTTGLYTATRPNREHAAVPPKESSRCQ